MSPNVATLALKKKYSDKANSPKGVACTFFKITSKWGIKTYTNRNSRDDCYDTQSMCAEYGYAPRVGEKFEFKIEDEVLYCYITEIAECLGDPIMELRFQYKADDTLYDKYITEYAAVEAKWEDDINELNDLMEDEIGWYCEDFHIFNYGILNGKLVVIDFGND